MARVRIDQALCKGCGLCVWVCQQDGLVVSEELNELGTYPVEFVRGAECTGCGNCASMCPEGGIDVLNGEPDDAVDGDGRQTADDAAPIARS